MRGPWPSPISCNWRPWYESRMPTHRRFGSAPVSAPNQGERRSQARRRGFCIADQTAGRQPCSRDSQGAWAPEEWKDWKKCRLRIPSSTGSHSGIAGLIFGIGAWVGAVNADRRSFKEFMTEVRDDLNKILARLPPRVFAGESPIELTDLGKNISARSTARIGQKSTPDPCAMKSRARSRTRSRRCALNTRRDTNQEKTWKG